MNATTGPATPVFRELIGVPLRSYYRQFLTCCCHCRLLMKRSMQDHLYGRRIVGRVIGTMAQMVTLLELLVLGLPASRAPVARLQFPGRCGKPHAASFQQFSVQLLQQGRGCGVEYFAIQGRARFDPGSSTAALTLTVMFLSARSSMAFNRQCLVEPLTPRF